MNITDTLQTIYRPNNWTGIIGQDETISILRGVVANKAYSYTRSYIFSGSPGSGKTTIGRILSNAIICDCEDTTKKPCLSCKSCEAFAKGIYPDYLEVDAGQYNKLEDIKQLIEVAKTYPIYATKHRLILVDEAHRLSNQAWDSMLKLLEEGTMKTIFIFATTEGDKIRDAIHSRSYSFKIKPLSVSEIYNELKRVCIAHNIEFDQQSLEAIATSNRGKMRDALKTLDMYYRSKGSVKEITMTTDEERVCDIIRHSTFNNIKEAMEILDQLGVANPNRIGSLFARVLSSLATYPVITISGIPDSTLKSLKTLLGADLMKLIKEFSTYKPETYEQVKLFLSIISDIGSNTQQVKQHTRKRQLFRNEQKEDYSDF